MKKTFTTISRLPNNLNKVLTLLFLSTLISLSNLYGQTLSPFNLLTPLQNDTILLTNTNLNDSVLLSWAPSKHPNGVDTTTYTFVLDTVGGDFSNPRFDIPSGMSPGIKLPKKLILQLANQRGITSGVLFAGIWRVKAQSKGIVRYSESTRNIFIRNSVITLSPFNLLTPLQNDTVLLTSTNLNDSVLLSWAPSKHPNGVDTTTYTFVLDTVGGDFSNPRFDIPSGMSPGIKLPKKLILQLANQRGITSGVLFAGIWRVKAQSKGIVRYSESTRNIFIRNSVITSVEELTRLDAINLYPNPAKEEAVLVGLIPHKDVISIIGVTGKTEAVFTASQTSNTLPVSILKSGIYFVKIQSGEAVVVKKLFVQ